MCSGRSFWPQLSGKTTRPRQQLLFIRTKTFTASPRTFVVKHCRVLQGHQQGGTHVCHSTKLTYFLHTSTHTGMRAIKVKVEHMEDRLYIHRNYCICLCVIFDNHIVYKVWMGKLGGTLRLDFSGRETDAPQPGNLDWVPEKGGWAKYFGKCDHGYVSTWYILWNRSDVEDEDK